MSEQTKKYSEMSMIDFITNILKIKLTEEQIFMIELFEENKTKPIVGVGNLFPQTKDISKDIPKITSRGGIVYPTTYGVE